MYRVYQKKLDSDNWLLSKFYNLLLYTWIYKRVFMLLHVITRQLGVFKSTTNAVDDKYVGTL